LLSRQVSAFPHCHESFLVAIGKLSRASGTRITAFLSRGAGFRFAAVSGATGFVCRVFRLLPLPNLGGEFVQPNEPDRTLPDVVLPNLDAMREAAVTARDKQVILKNRPLVAIDVGRDGRRLGWRHVGGNPVTHAQVPLLYLFRKSRTASQMISTPTRIIQSPAVMERVRT
jgi:hypothetical protein